VLCWFLKETREKEEERERDYGEVYLAFWEQYEYEEQQ
jgi:hypothetical protein